MKNLSKILVNFIAAIIVAGLILAGFAGLGALVEFLAGSTIKLVVGLSIMIVIIYFMIKKELEN